MYLHFLDNEHLWFPPVEAALDDGLLAVGGELTTDRLLLAYRNGIFPWYDEGEPLWWCPDPRFVLFPQELKVSKSMQQFIRNTKLRFTVDAAFNEVIHQCRITERKDHDGTWINDDIIDSYTELHKMGFAHSAEAWLDDTLVGGLYGVRLGKMFFGESMFSSIANASKFAFIHYVQQLKRENVALIDCQVYTPHLESLGARMIPRTDFISIVHSSVDS